MKTPSFTNKVFLVLLYFLALVKKIFIARLHATQNYHRDTDLYATKLYCPFTMKKDNSTVLLQLCLPSFDLLET